MKNILIFFCSILMSCFSSNSLNKLELEKNKNFIHISLPKIGESVLKASEFADTVLYIPLETSSQSLFKRIAQLQILEDHILINSVQSLLLFSKNGRFIRQIGKQGKGPGEHLLIFDFLAVSDTIYISSSGKRSLIKYTMNGEFIEEIPSPHNFQIAWFDITHNNKIVSYTGIDDRGELYYLDKNLSEIDTVTIDFDAPSNPAPFMLVDLFDFAFQHGGKNRILFTSYMSDTIWDISNSEKNKGLVLNLGDKVLPEKYRFCRFNGDYEHFQKVTEEFQKIKVLETPSYLLFFQKGWTEKDINAIYIHDLDHSTTKKYETPYIYDDMVGKQNIIPRYTSGNCIVGTIDPVEFTEDLKNYKANNESYSAIWYQHMSNTKEDDNLILVIIPVSEAKR